MVNPGPVDPTMARVLDATAVAGGRVHLSVLARVLGLGPGPCLAVVERAVRSGVLRTEPGSEELCFVDDDTREATERRLSLTARAELHRRLAAALELEPGADHTRVVRHWASAVAVTLDPLERARLQFRLAAAGMRAGDLTTARAAARAAVAVARRSGSTELLAEAASTLRPIGDPAWDGDIEQWCAEALSARALEEPTRVRLLARRAQAAVYCGRWREAYAASADALRRAEDLGEVDLLVEALTARQLATSGPDDVEELVGLAARMVDLGTSTGRAEVELWGRLWRVDALWYGGDLAAIASETTRLEGCVGRVEGPWAQWHVPAVRAALSLARAEFDRADLLMDEAVGLLDRLGHPAAYGASVSFHLVLGHHRGPSDRLLDPGLWEFGSDPRWQMFSPLARAFALVDSGRTDEAAAEYRRCGAPEGWDLPRFGALVVDAVAARVAAAIGATQDVGFLRGRLEPRRGRYVVGGAGATNFLGPVELALGACSAALGDWDRAGRDLRRASGLCREIGAPGFGVEADCLLAETLDRSGDRSAGRAVARDALPLARTLGMTPWVGRLERLVTSADPLSPREREVATLVADGLSNREIATTLVISERTAQNHVQHILAKLGFVNRAQVAAWTTRQRPR